MDLGNGGCVDVAYLGELLAQEGLSSGLAKGRGVIRRLAAETCTNHRGPSGRVRGRRHFDSMFAEAISVGYCFLAQVCIGSGCSDFSAYLADGGGMV